jgi:hypothetical protein
MNKLSLILLAAACLPAATLNDLYFGLDNMNHFRETYFWFLADGRVFEGLPNTGLTPPDFETACTPTSAICGTYVLDGAKLSIKYRSGRSETWTYAALNGGMQLNYLIFTPIKKYPAGTRLNGTFSHPYSSAVASGPVSAVVITAPTFFTFKPDGTYQGQAITGVSRTSDVKGANGSDSAQSQWSGIYTIQDFVLSMVRNGKTERHMIFPAPGDNLNIDGTVYTKQK